MLILGFEVGACGIAHRPWGAGEVLVDYAVHGLAEPFCSGGDCFADLCGDRFGFLLHTPGQMTHILRHTFASQYMMEGGNILTLQRILGHGDIKMTMRYSHLAPDHFATALTMSPLALLEDS